MSEEDTGTGKYILRQADRIVELSARIREQQALLDECEASLIRLHLATQHSGTRMSDVAKEVRDILAKLRKEADR